MLPLRLTARGCVTAAREGCSKFAFTTPNLRPGTDGIGCVSPVFAVGAAARTPARDYTAVPLTALLPLVRTAAPGAKCGQISDTPNVILALFTLPAGHSGLTTLTCRALSHRSDQPCPRCRRSPRQQRRSTRAP